MRNGITKSLISLILGFSLVNTGCQTLYKHHIAGERQDDGSYIYEFPRDPELQKHLREGRELVLTPGLPEAPQLLGLGHVWKVTGLKRDLKSYRAFPDGSGVASFYDE